MSLQHTKNVEELFCLSYEEYFAFIVYVIKWHATLNKITEMDFIFCVTA
jgi:hypothetical protein